jgi:hypothetical protein
MLYIYILIVCKSSAIFFSSEGVKFVLIYGHSILVLDILVEFE